MAAVRLIAVWTAAGLLAFTFMAVQAQGPSSKKYPRVRPPAFDPQETSGIFFDDVFRQAIQGERPADSGTAPRATPASPPSTPRSQPTAGPGSGEGAARGWSQLIAAASIEDEVKSLKLQVDQAVSTPNQFRGRDYKTCRQHFTVLAMLFAIVEEYDGDVRWKEASPALRQAFARAAANCKTGSDQAFNEAKARKLDLQDAIGGGAVNLPEAKPRESWEGVCDRSPLMQRLESTVQELLRPKTANSGEFQTHLDVLYREAQLVSAIGRALKQPGMMDAGDQDYDQFCDAMSRAAGSLAEAVKTNRHDQAASAVGQITQACSGCHELYR